MTRATAGPHDVAAQAVRSKRPRDADDRTVSQLQIVQWLEQAGLKPADADRYGTLLLDMGCETAVDVRDLISSGRAWPDWSGIKPAHRIKMESHAARCAAEGSGL